MPSYSSPSLHAHITQSEAQRIRKDRMAGLYQTNETQNEAYLCLDNYAKDAYCFTLNHKHGVFTDYPKEEFSKQVAQWKSIKAKCETYNIKPIEYRGKTFWMFVIQPTDLEQSHWCPLGMAFNTLVNGWTYITRKKEVAEWVARRLA